MTTEQQAALNLINRAMDESKQSTAYLLIDSAYRLDESIDVNQVRADWLDKWLQENKDRTK